LAEPLGCCINGMERVGMSIGKTVVIIGAGPVGLMLAGLARVFGAHAVVLVDRDERRLRFAKSIISELTVISGRGNWGPPVMTWTQGKGADRIFVACPVADAQEMSIQCVAKRGVINCFGGLPPGNRPIKIDSNILHYKEAYLMGSHGSTPRQHALALSLIASGKIPVKKIITHRFDLKDIIKAFRFVESQKGMKAVVTALN
jgi:L-iditol 2-dehydrogenase